MPTTKVTEATAISASNERSSGSYDHRAKLLSAANHVAFNTVYHPRVSTFIPNCWTMFTILHAMHVCVGDNADLLRVCPAYCTIVSRLYYSILWFVQVLRAKHTAGIITSSESDFLLWFTSMYPMHSLDIAGPLVAYFEGLGAIRSPDPIYTWVCPTLATKLGPSKASHGLKANRSLLYPIVPGIVALIHSIVSCSDFEKSTNHIWDFIPFQLTEGRQFAGQTLSGYEDMDDLPKYWQEMLDLPGINISPEQSYEVLKEVRPHLLKVGSFAWIEADTPLEFLSEFMQMGDSMMWFREVAKIASIEAKFFRDSTTMDSISSTTGAQTLVIGITPPPTCTSHRPTDWYPGLRIPDDARFYTIHVATSQADLRLGVINQIIRTVPDNIKGHGPMGTIGSGDLVGPYWENNIYRYETSTSLSAQPCIGQVVAQSFYLPSGGALADEEMD